MNITFGKRKDICKLFVGRHNYSKGIVPNIQRITIFGNNTSKLIVPITIQDQQFTMELGTARTGNYISLSVLKQLGKLKLDDVRHRYGFASNHELPVLETFNGQTKGPRIGKQNSIRSIVTKISDLNLLRRNSFQILGISVDNVLALRRIQTRMRVQKDCIPRKL